MAKIYGGMQELIGNTPLVELAHLEKRYGLGARLLAKLEYFNPAGSAKDRIAKEMIEQAADALHRRAGCQKNLEEASEKLKRFLSENPDIEQQFSEEIPDRSEERRVGKECRL